jgi:tagaturonate reductase
MNLSRYTVKNINAQGVALPDEALFDLPERCLQFGTGVLLRGLPIILSTRQTGKAYLMEELLVVKSTDGGDAAAFDSRMVCIHSVYAARCRRKN